MYIRKSNHNFKHSSFCFIFTFLVGIKTLQCILYFLSEIFIFLWQIRSSLVVCSAFFLLLSKHSHVFCEIVFA